MVNFSSIRKILGAVAISLATYSTAYPQQKQTEHEKRRNIVYVDSECSQKTSLTFGRDFSSYGDGIFLKGYTANLNLDENSNINLDNYFCLKARDGRLSYRFIDINKGLENVINYLEIGSGLSQNENAFLNYLKNLRNKTEKNDSLSVYLLNKAVSDNIIDSQNDSLFIDGKPRILAGKYMLIAKSKSTEEYTSNSIPIILELNLRRVKQREYEEEYEEHKYEERETEKTKKREKTRRIKFGIDGFLGKDGFYSNGLFFGYDPVRISVNYSRKDDRLVDSLTVPLSNGRFGVGKKEEEDFSSSGASLEFHLRNFLMGFGINNWSFTESVEEKILVDERILKLSQNSKTRQKISTRFYGGFELPLDNFVLRIMAGRDKLSGWYAGLGTGLRLR